MEATTETALVPQYSWLELTGEEPPAEAMTLPPAQIEGLQQIFAPFMQEILVMETEASEVNVTEEDDKAGMAEARRLRLAIKNIRVEAGKVHKVEKEYPKIAGRAVDWFWRMIRERAEINEARLEHMEKLAERMEAERREARRQERAELLSPFVESTDHYDLGNMTPEGFAELLESSKVAHESRIEAERKAEEERQAQVEADRIERERLAAENERLRLENEAAQAELQARQQAEEAAARTEREAQERAASASDKDKLRALYRAIQGIQIPDMQSNEYLLIAKMAESGLRVVLGKIESEAKKLEL